MDLETVPLRVEGLNPLNQTHLNALAAPRKWLEILSIKMNRTELVTKGNPHQKWVGLTFGDADQTVTPVVQGLYSPYQKVHYPVLPGHR